MGSVFLGSTGLFSGKVSLFVHRPHSQRLWPGWRYSRERRRVLRWPGEVRCLPHVASRP
jgi:hypothetical protein